MKETGVLIIGAGGHAQVVAEILFEMQAYRENVRPIGYLDDNPSCREKRFLGLSVLGTCEEASSFTAALIIGIGDNETRKKLFDRFRLQGRALITARHPTSIVGRDSEVGTGSVLCPSVVINPATRVGVNVILNTGCTVDHHNHIADHVHIAPGAHLGGNVCVGEGALVGIGAVITPCRKIGPWSVVGAGAVVIDDIPAGVVAVGCPARVLRKAMP